MDLTSMAEDIKRVNNLLKVYVEKLKMLKRNSKFYQYQTEDLEIKVKYIDERLLDVAK